MLKRSAPESVTIGRGFVVHQERCSTQIDVLIYDNSMPILYKDGDLVFITPAACRGIVEVKSTISSREFRVAVDKLAANAEFIRQLSGDFHIFVGLFSYDMHRNSCERLLEALADATNGQPARIIDHVALGASKLIKYWHARPEDISGRMNYNQWHLYSLDRMAPGYFIQNLLLSVSRNIAAQREGTWFPDQSKEAFLERTIAFNHAR
jgi:hypothetical protein